MPRIQTICALNSTEQPRKNQRSFFYPNISSCNSRAVLRDVIFFFVKDLLLRTGPDLEFSPFFTVPEKNAEIGITGQKISGAHARRSPFYFIWAWDGIFFPVKDRPVQFPYYLWLILFTFSPLKVLKGITF